MMARRVILGLIGGAVSLLTLGACSFRLPFRYKMVVEVETPEGVKSGFAVREIYFTARANGGHYGHVTGEAVAVDLPGGQVLFAILLSDGGDPDYSGHEIASMFRQAESDRIQLWPNPPKFYEPIIDDSLPMLVRFKDMADPKTVERVDPANLAASFGAGVRLKRIHVAKTDEPLTVGIGHRLGWLRQYYGRQFSGDRFQHLDNKSKGLSAFMSAGAFSAGLGLSPYEGGKPYGERK